MGQKRCFRVTVSLTLDEWEVLTVAAMCSRESPGRFLRKWITETIERDRLKAGGGHPLDELSN